MMGGVAGEADMAALIEDRHHDGDVGRMAGAEIGMVVDDDIALAPGRRHRGLDAAEIAGDRADMQRGVVALAERREGAVEEAGAEILALADDGREGHPVEDVCHLAGDGVQRAADDLKRDGIDAHDATSAEGCWLRAMRILPAFSMRAVKPGGTRVVELCCRMIAGPGTTWPALRRSRS